MYGYGHVRDNETNYLRRKPMIGVKSPLRLKLRANWCKILDPASWTSDSNSGIASSLDCSVAPSCSNSCIPEINQEGGLAKGGTTAVATQDRDAFEHLHARRRERGEPSAFENLEARRTQLIRTNFEPQLTNLGLSVEHIERQNLDELNQSLNKVNDAISHPENFGTLTLEAGGGVGFFGLNLSEKAHIEIGILPLLL